MMSQRMKKYYLPIFLMSLVIIFAVFAAWLYYPREAKLPIVDKIPSFSMKNIDGHTITQANTNGKVRLFYFYFTHCPDVCPPTTYMLSEVQTLLKEKGVFGRDVKLISISFDPKRDTLDVMKSWAQKFHADYAGWYFLHGQEDDIMKMVNGFKSAVKKDQQGNFIHLNIITLVDQNGYIRKAYSANDHQNVSAEKITHDIMRLLN